VRVRTTWSCATTSAKVWGRYFRYKATYDTLTPPWGVVFGGCRMRILRVMGWENWPCTHRRRLLPGVTRAAGSGPAPPRHTRGPAYRCSLPGPIGRASCRERGEVEPVSVAAPKDMRRLRRVTRQTTATED